MVTLSVARIDELIAEDVPYIDLTSHILGIDAQAGAMEYFTREACVLAGGEVASRIATKLGCVVTNILPDGTALEAGQSFMTIGGTAAQLHQAWKVCLNVFDHLSAVATNTTRKSMPGVKDLLVEATIAGGAFPHRLGLSETVLVFDHHLSFMGGIDALIEQLPQIRSRCIEKKLFVEVNAEQALALAWHNAACTRACAASRGTVAWAGVDGVQLDKVAVDELAELVGNLRALDPRLTIIAAGGVNPENAGEYAATGVDGLATTAPFTAKPIDMSVRMRRLG